MYADWASVREEIQRSTDHESVLTLSFPTSVGKEVAGSVVHYLAFMVGKNNDDNEPSSLTTDTAVKWTMQVGDDDDVGTPSQYLPRNFCSAVFMTNQS